MISELLKSTTSNNKIFSIDGNIGSGKSTIKSILEKKYNNKYIFLREPVDLWDNIKDENGNTILSKFYGDIKTYAFSFQMMAYISRLALLREICRNNPDKIIISERCVETDKNVFAKMLFDDGNIEKVNYQIYLQWFDEFIKDFPITGYIYIDTSPEKCSERINIRNREGETIPIDYLINCDKYHNEWLSGVDSHVLRIDGSCDINSENYNNNLNKIVSFIENVANSY
jgi:deoxyadenosine/deoxycytidine kinase